MEEVEQIIKQRPLDKLMTEARDLKEAKMLEQKKKKEEKEQEKTRQAQRFLKEAQDKQLEDYIFSTHVWVKKNLDIERRLSVDELTDLKPFIAKRSLVQVAKGLLFLPFFLGATATVPAVFYLSLSFIVGSTAGFITSLFIWILILLFGMIDNTSPKEEGDCLWTKYFFRKYFFEPLSFLFRGRYGKKTIKRCRYCDYFVREWNYFNETKKALKEKFGMEDKGVVNE